MIQNQDLWIIMLTFLMLIPKGKYSQSEQAYFTNFTSVRQQSENLSWVWRQDGSVLTLTSAELGSRSCSIHRGSSGKTQKLLSFQRGDS